MNRKTIALSVLALGLAATAAFGQAAPSSNVTSATITNAPPKDPPWDASAAFGLSLTRGNSETLNIVFDLNATKKWDEGRNEFRFGANYTYSEDDSSTTANQVGGFVQYNRMFTDRLYAYLRFTGLHDEIADLDYRFTISPGLGYYFIKTVKTSLSAEVGPGYVFERKAGVNDDYFTIRFAERFDHKFTDKAKMWQAVEYLPAVDDWMDNYVINFEIGLDTAITKHLSQRTYFQDTYDSTPAPGKKSNDMKIVAAVAYKF